MSTYCRTKQKLNILLHVATVITFYDSTPYQNKIFALNNTNLVEVGLAVGHSSFLIRLLSFEHVQTSLLLLLAIFVAIHFQVVYSFLVYHRFRFRRISRNIRLVLTNAEMLLIHPQLFVINVVKVTIY